MTVLREQAMTYLTPEGEAWLTELERCAIEARQDAARMAWWDLRRWLRIAEVSIIERRLQHGRWGEAHARLVNNLGVKADLNALHSRDCAATAFPSREHTLETLLRDAVDDYAEHSHWRCDHQDRYPWNPECLCGYTVWERETRAALGDAS